MKKARPWNAPTSPAAPALPRIGDWHSTLSIQHSALSIQHSALSIQHSALRFSIQHSALKEHARIKQAKLFSPQRTQTTQRRLRRKMIGLNRIRLLFDTVARLSADADADLLIAEC